MIRYAPFEMSPVALAVCIFVNTYTNPAALNSMLMIGDACREGRAVTL